MASKQDTQIWEEFERQCDVNFLYALLYLESSLGTLFCRFFFGVAFSGVSFWYGCI